ncbi:MAG: PocR ligand-binding domain-containing protein [Proteobacteria bacterium]|nr:PocR ligand-binding domain-containing protein [Pseudomonadota bacterium]MBU4384100.1 PocR ligand-binding domain-containing protein [Pseudomonadota bacterium]MCG2763739.1 PocR ligand-binding domain-containing protein [Desulfarculaceae bacterium]
MPKPTDKKLVQKVKVLGREPLGSEVKADFDIPDAGDLTSILNVAEVQSIMDDFYHLTGMATAILDLKGKVLERTGWQDICTKFHRKHPQTSQNCTESDLFIAKNLKPGEYVEYKCKNGLWDVVTPLYVGNIHLGNIYTGHFFYDDEQIDEEVFVKQAEMYGFDKEAYLDAFGRIPRYSRKNIHHLMSFLVKFAAYLSKISLANVQLQKEINERKQAEAALRDSEARLRTLIHTIPDLVWLKDQQGTYTLCNSRFESFFGASEKNIIGKSDYDFVDKEMADHFRRHDKIAMAQGKPSKNVEEVTFADDGHREILETIKTPMYTSDGQLAGVLGIGRDITERTRAQEEKLLLEEQYHQAQKVESIGRLAGGVAHDYNNALSVIIGFTELAMDEVDPAGPLRANLDQVLTAAQRAADITRQLLAFARKQPIAPQVLDLNGIVESMLKMLRRLISEEIDLTWAPGTELWPVKLDPSQVDQILANLCVNARDAIEEQGKITIETGNATFDDAYCADHSGFIPGEFVLLAVSDNGCGIGKDILDNMFEPFFTTKDADKGTGLGLSTVYGIVKQNKGFINVYSEPGEGTTIKLYLPRHQGEAVAALGPDPEGLPQGRGETILLVEDDLPIIKLAKKTLQGLGYKVLAARTPFEAMALAEQHPGGIDLLLTDVIMPQMNGRDLALRLQTLFPKLKCVFMSGYTANVIAHHGVLDQGVHFIQKPFYKKDMAKMVRKALDE